MVSALRFLFQTVLGKPRLAMSLPRPRKESRLPAVLSQGEVVAYWTVACEGMQVDGVSPR